MFMLCELPHANPDSATVAAEYMKANSNYKKDETWLAIGESFLAFCVLWLTWIHLTFFLNRFQVPVAGMVCPRGPSSPRISCPRPYHRLFSPRFPRMLAASRTLYRMCL